MSSILDKIISEKIRWVAESKCRQPLAGFNIIIPQYVTGLASASNVAHALNRSLMVEKINRENGICHPGGCSDLHCEYYTPEMPLSKPETQK
jgi:hypothetical protein